MPKRKLNNSIQAQPPSYEEFCERNAQRLAQEGITLAQPKKPAPPTVVSRRFWKVSAALATVCVAVLVGVFALPTLFAGNSVAPKPPPSQDSEMGSTPPTEQNPDEGNGSASGGEQYAPGGGSSSLNNFMESVVYDNKQSLYPLFPILSLMPQAVVYQQIITGSGKIVRITCNGVAQTSGVAYQLYVKIPQPDGIRFLEQETYDALSDTVVVGNQTYFYGVKSDGGKYTHYLRYFQSGCMVYVRAVSDSDQILPLLQAMQV